MLSIVSIYNDLWCYLSSTTWNKNSPPPRLPENVILETQNKYKEAYEKITGNKLIFDQTTLKREI